jgi:hypothetical protein
MYTMIGPRVQYVQGYSELADIISTANGSLRNMEMVCQITILVC